MTKAAVFMDAFMEKLRTDRFEKDNQPNSGPNIDEAFVKRQVESYTHLLKSDILDLATK